MRSAVARSRRRLSQVTAIFADNADLYYPALPGEKVLRVIPNAGHRDVVDFTGQSLSAFVNRIQKMSPLPSVEAGLHGQTNAQTLEVGFSERPVQVTLWTATNLVKRDFRQACGVKYVPSPLTLLDAQNIQLPLVKPASGWQAVFLEAIFDDGFIATTPVYVLPNDIYPAAAPPSNVTTCRTLAGRAHGIAAQK